MKQLVLLHGMGATSKNQWLPFLNKYFIEQGWDVVSPDIPDSDKPDLDRWLQFVNVEFKLTSETILVGHSAGCPLILSLLERSNVQISKSILVGGFVEDIGSGVRPILQPEYDWQKIKQNCKEFYYVNSDNDPYKCNDKQGRILLDNLGGTQIIMAGEGHFGTEEFNQPYPEFPFLIKLIKD